MKKTGKFIIFALITCISLAINVFIFIPRYTDEQRAVKEYIDTINKNGLDTLGYITDSYYSSGAADSDNAVTDEKTGIKFKKINLIGFTDSESSSSAADTAFGIDNLFSGAGSNVTAIIEIVYEGTDKKQMSVCSATTFSISKTSSGFKVID